MITLLLGEATWNIPLLWLIVGIVCLYGYGLFWHMKTSNEMKDRTWKRQFYTQSAYFLLGMGLLYFLYGSPILAISNLSFSFHMIHMSIFLFIVPPLLLLGIPFLLYHPIVNTPLVKKIGKLFPPIYSLYGFAFLLFIYHFPPIIGSISQYPFIQNGYMIGLFLLSLRSWWPIISPDGVARLSKKNMKKYAFKSVLLVTPACLFFIVSAWLEGASNPLLAELSEHVCLPPESSTSILPAPFHTKYDQVAAGLFMMGLHKIALTVGCKLGNKKDVHLEEES